MDSNTIIEYLDIKLNKDPLPGMDILSQMAPMGRQLNYPESSDYINSAVVVLLYEKGNDIYFSLIKRTSFNKNDKHKGQISLPGGKYDIEDKALLNCAIRELEEEIGIKEEYIKVLGELTKLYIPISNFMVQPFVFFMEEKNKFYPQESEVEYILEIKLNDLFDEKNNKKGKIEVFKGRVVDNIPYFLLNNHIIWGATAMILNEFKNVMVGFKTK